jgi:hypothetical protein
MKAQTINWNNFIFVPTNSIAEWKTHYILGYLHNTRYKQLNTVHKKEQFIHIELRYHLSNVHHSATSTEQQAHSNGIRLRVVLIVLLE